MQRWAARLWAVSLGLALASTLWGCAAKVQAPPEPPGTVRRAEEAFRLRDYERAIELYRTYADLVRRDPYVPRVLYKAALAQYELGRYEDVLATLDDLQGRYPDKRWVQVEALRGDAQRALGNPIAAIQAWDQAFTVARPADESKLRLRIATVARSLSDEELTEASQLVASKPAREILAAVVTQREQPEIPEPLPEFETGLAQAEGTTPGAPGGEAEATEGTLGTGSALAGPSGAAAEAIPETRLIGVLASSGTADQGLVQAVKLAVDPEWIAVREASGGANVTAAFADLGADPRVVAVIGSSAGRAEELARVARERALPFVDVDGAGVGGPYFVSAGVARNEALGALLDYAIGRARLRRFGVVYPDTLAGRQFFAFAQAEILRRGGEIVGSDAYASDTRGLTAGLVRRWRDKENLQAVLLSDDAVAAATFARFLQREMPDIPLLGVDAWETVGNMVPEVSGVVFVSPFSPDRATHPFVEQFREAVGRLPDAREVCAYEAAVWLRHAVASVPPGSARAEVWAALQRSDTFEGPSGTVEVAGGRFVRRPVVVQFTKGELHEVPHPVATAQLAGN